MIKCDYTGCNIGIHSPVQGVTTCHKHCVERVYDKAPSQRTRKDIEILIAHTESQIKAMQGKLQVHKNSLADLPVQVEPGYLRRLQEREQLLRRIELEVEPCHRPDGIRDIGDALLGYIRRTGCFRGVRF